MATVENRLFYNVTDDDVFRPQDPMTREKVEKVMDNSKKLNSDGLLTFFDASQPKNSMVKDRNGMVVNDSEGNFKIIK